MTYSIVARDARTGAFGVATATGGPAVGALVPHIAAGGGAIATQGSTNPLYGTDGMAALLAGEAAGDMVARLTNADPGRDDRQLIAIGREGPAAGWSGSGLRAAAGMSLQDDVAIAGNLLSDAAVLQAMLEAFRSGGRSGLAPRLLAAMEAGEAAGGDRRGTMSAALKIVTDQPYPAIDLRVDHHPEPVKELGRLLQVTTQGSYADFFAGLPKRQR